MNEHLKEGQLRAALDGEVAAEALDHLRSCPACQARQRAIQSQRERTAANEARVEKLATAPDWVSGRQGICGTVLSTKLHETPRWGTLVMKALVELPDGRRAWGTLPSLVVGPDGQPVAGSAKGLRVKFTATIELSQNDPKFAFYKRPSNMEVTA